MESSCVAKGSHRYGFQDFIAGPSNQAAFEAALAVSRAPAKAHNPLIIFGDPGLGKTHLLQAIGGQIRHTTPRARILASGSETFNGDLLRAMTRSTYGQHQGRYTDCDLLLFDDFQFLRDTPQVQKEFYLICDKLLENGKQVVVTAEMNTYSTLRRSTFGRFCLENGLMETISPPSFAERQKFLMERALKLNHCLPAEVIEHIAAMVEGSYCELEGGLNRVVAFSNCFHKPIQLSTAQLALSHISHISLPKRWKVHT